MLYGALQILNAQVNRFSVLQNSGNRDFEAELLYQTKKVAIYSKGDNQTDCYNAITNYSNSNINVLILAHSSLHRRRYLLLCILFAFLADCLCTGLFFNRQRFANIGKLDWLAGCNPASIINFLSNEEPCGLPHGSS